MNYWLVKTEPGDYTWETFIKEKETIWDGVRNYQARNYLREMKPGEWVLFYRSVKKPAIVGLAKVSQPAFPDPTDTTARWSAVRLKAIKPLQQELPLKKLRTVPELADLRLLKQPRLSVMPVAEEHFFTILALANTQLS